MSMTESERTYIREQWDQVANQYRGTIPYYTIEGLENYLFDKVPVGHFLSAVLDNDLFEAVGRADDENSKALRDIVRLIYNGMPGAARRRKEWLA